MATIKRDAPAKINLTLHITGQRADGYHLLDSLVVFSDLADHLSASPAPSLSLKVSGSFAEGVPTDDTNLIIRAAKALQTARGVTAGAALTLEKNLPHAAGIGSGSSDAACALAMLAEFWGVAPLPVHAPQVLTLGADVPACLRGRKPTCMSGIGEVLDAAPALPPCAVVLARPPVQVPTGKVFQGLINKNGTPMDPTPVGMSLDDFAAWLRQQRNDLLPPSRNLAPEIGRAINKLNTQASVVFAGMSGSGATCFGLVKDMGTARQVARVIQVSHRDWWVAPGQVLT